MTHRIAYPAASAFMSLLLLLVMGCGQAHRALSPDPGDGTGAVAIEPTSQFRLDGEDAALDGKDDERPDWLSHAIPIQGATVIETPGNYRLVSDIEVVAGDGIVIRASGVRLWLGDHRLRGPGNKAGRAIVLDGAQHVVVRGGHIERFGIGVVALASSECSVHGIDIRGGDETADPPNGNPPQIGIMLVNSSKLRISRNGIRNVNLGIFVRGGSSFENVIRRNEVVAGNHGLLGICYNPAPAGGPAGPRHDRVTHNVLNRFGTGIVASEQSAMNYFRSNSIRYFASAYVDRNGTNVFERNQVHQITP